jgi:TetR/AcrR family transcriptional regulator
MGRTGAVRREPAGKKVREKIYAAAARVFAQKGYASATVQEIVERAGVTKPALYYYFGSKEGAYRAILEKGLSDFGARMDAVDRMKGRAPVRLRRLCEELFALSHEHLDAVRLMHFIYYGLPQGAPSFDFDRVLLRLHDMVRKIVRQGVRSGEFRGNPEAMTLAVLGACNECIDLELVHPEMGVDRAGFGRVIDVVLRGMERKDGR